jgi:DUF1680 family protein
VSEPEAMSTLRPVDFTKVKLKDSFWRKRAEINRTVTIPAMYKHLKETGRLDSIDPNHKPGDPSAHHIFWDSDIAKWIEASAYTLSIHPDPNLEKIIDQIVSRFETLQREDSYLNSWFIKVEPDKRWTNLRDKHELYCFGHLAEAAVAYYQATGKRQFLDIMLKYADYIDSVFGPQEGKLQGYPGHEEAELALVKLYHTTGKRRYLDLAQFFIDARGTRPHYYEEEALKRGEDPIRTNHEYNQAHLPVREQTRVVGHAVRAMYLYSGMADVAKETGDRTLAQACMRLWEDLCLKQMYVTGGIGQTRTHEGFTFHYDFPEETAYCETCASIGLVFWAHRLLQMEKDSQFADVMELALYNGTISGYSLSGDRFFYENPMASLGDHHRQDWFRCSCCPPNISRMIAGIGQYIYSVDDAEAWVHLYVQGSVDLSIGQKNVHIEQYTGYPWDGTVRLSVDVDEPLRFTLALRIPRWCNKASISVNGTPVDLDGIVTKGYAKIEREWSSGNEVVLKLDMPVEKVSAHPFARQMDGKIALQRGPIVYCLEEVDNPVTPLNRISLPYDAELSVEYEPDLLGGIAVISGMGEIIDDQGWENTLYSSKKPLTKPFPIRAVPYCVWDNREPGQMLVWVRTKNWEE